MGMVHGKSGRLGKELLPREWSDKDNIAHKWMVDWGRFLEETLPSFFGCKGDQRKGFLLSDL